MEVTQSECAQMPISVNNRHAISGKGSKASGHAIPRFANVLQAQELLFVSLIEYNQQCTLYSYQHMIRGYRQNAMIKRCVPGKGIKRKISLTNDFICLQAVD